MIFTVTTKQLTFNFTGPLGDWKKFFWLLPHYHFRNSNTADARTQTTQGKQTRLWHLVVTTSAMATCFHSNKNNARTGLLTLPSCYLVTSWFSKCLMSLPLVHQWTCPKLSDRAITSSWL